MPTWTNRSNCSFNCSWDDNATYWGFEHPVNIFPIPVLTGVTVTCVLFFFVGVTGNLMTILVVTKYKDMRTTTNLYLSSMAFSDLLIFLCMPLDLYRIWRYRPWNFGNILCKLFQFQGEETAISLLSYFHSLSLTAVVVFAFVLCWLPFHVGRYLISKSTEMGSPVMSVISHYCNLISFVLFYLSAAINPILYNIMSKKYRMAACKLFGLHHTPRRSTSVVKGESSPCWTESTASL
ncbi:growth hormone secretagogue receptor type 1-like protein [Labeo rohita]|uniref:Growth hormone secretagogue receptor type 1-like protein n=1 Tax=Labeo rohita TaxID=84645 RepID=A0A498LBR4_LABRO|nr:growth hormone secretagogue receptor type 1-like protein [Labeo rohita]